MLFDELTSSLASTTVSDETVTSAVDSLWTSESATAPLSLNKVDSLSDTDSLNEAVSLAKMDSLNDTEDDVERLADSVVDSTAFSETEAESNVDTEPSTKLSVSARVSSFTSDAVATSFPASSAYAVLAIDVAPRRAPAATIPFNKPRLVISLVDTESSRISATTVSSTWPRITLSKPKLEVDARNQFLPDLINLNRVTRSVSRNSPFERLKNILFSFIYFFHFNGTLFLT